jgi:myo-inositol-1(or 4)-monophosphatase
LQSAASDLPLLEAAAREAGAIARAAFRTKVETWSKGAAGPVTEVDLAINDMLNTRLRPQRPDYGWLSEETADNPDRLSRDRVWVIDPIDGTQAFIDGEPQFTIAIGVTEKGRAVSGAIYNPITDEMYLGADGAAATLNGEPIGPSKRDKLEGANVIAYKRLFADSKWPRPWPELKYGARHSIALRLALVAAGKFDATVLFGMKNVWDVAAGAAILQAAGAQCTDPWGAPLDFNRADPRVPGVVAAGPALHALLIERTTDAADPRLTQKEAST